MQERVNLMDGNTETDSQKAARKGMLKIGILLCAIFILCVAGLVEILLTAKMHYHFVVGTKNGKAEYLSILRNVNAVDLFGYAQAHDLAGENDLASEDYRASVEHESFEKLPEKVKPTLLELVDSREKMDPHDYFAELVTHSRISYWSQAQMPLKVYVPDESKKDGFCEFDRKLVESCFDEWCAIVPGRISYKMVNDPEHADIVFSQKPHLIDLSYSRSVLAHTIPTPSGPEVWAVFPASKARIEPIKFYPEIKDKSDKRAVLRHTVFLHEIGHSLGIIGHSCHAGDLMFFSGSGTLSKRDKATFRRIYEPGNVYERAEKAMRELAQAKDKYALIQLAMQLEENGTASPARVKEVFKAAKEAADLGSGRALLMLGWMYHDGNGVRRNLKEASRCFHQASVKASSGALLALASLYERGDGEKQDLDAAEKYLKMAMKMDITRAPVAYANYLSYQFGDKASLERAAAFYKRNASKEQVEALMRLALIYEHGQGVEKDLKEAEELRAKARKQMDRLKAKNAAEYFARGCAFSEVCESDKAIADLTEAIRLKPDFRAGYLARGAAEQACGKNEEACADMTKALELDPECVQALLGRAYSYIGLGKAKEALQDVNKILAITHAPDSDRIYAQIIGSLACRILKDEKTAATMIDEAAAGTTENAWPGPIVRFLQHKISEADFKKMALGYSRATEVRFYLGMDQSISGKNSDAIENLRWVKENGDRTFYEYPVAIAMLGRIPKARP